MIRSAGDFVRHVCRSFDPAARAGLEVVIALQDFAGDALGAEDQTVGFSRAAVLGVDVEGRYEIDFSRHSLSRAF